MPPPTSLHERAKSQVAESFKSGFYAPGDIKLIPSLSNTIFQDLRCTRGIANALQKNIEKSLLLTELNFLGCVVGENEKALMKSSNLEKLSFGCLNLMDANEFRRYTRDGKFDIADFLEDVLNNETKSKLKFLNISGTEVLHDSWPKKLSELLPSLEELVFHHRPCIPTIFREVVYYFKALKKLDISNTEMHIVPDFHLLENLEVLVMRNAKIWNGQVFYSLYYCHNLTTLDMSYDFYGDDNSVIGMFCSELELGCLASLKSLDCSQANVSEDMVNKLIETLPTLKQISLVGTPLDKHQFPLEIKQKCAFSSLVDLDSTMLALDQYTRLDRDRIVALALTSLIEIFNVESDLNTVKSVLVNVCESMNSFKKSSEVQFLGAKLIYEMCKDNKILLFDSRSIDRALDAFGSACTLDVFTDRQTAHLHTLYWKLVADDALLDRHHELRMDLNTVFSVGTRTFQHADRHRWAADIANAQFTPILKVFNFFAEHRPEFGWGTSTTHTSGPFLSSLLDMLNVYGMDESIDEGSNRRVGFTFLVRMLRNSKNTCRSFNRYGVLDSIIYMIGFREIEEVFATDILETLVVQIMDHKQLQEFYDSEVIKTLARRTEQRLDRIAYRICGIFIRLIMVATPEHYTYKRVGDLKKAILKCVEFEDGVELGELHELIMQSNLDEKLKRWSRKVHDPLGNRRLANLQIGN